MAEEKTEYKERTDIILDEANGTATWAMRLEGDIHGTYVGSFRFKCYLSPLEQIAADRERRELLGPQPFAAGEHESFLAYALTQLKYRIVTSPPFWASANPASLSGDLPDENIIAAVLDSALGSEIKYKEKLKAKKLESAKRARKAIEKDMAGDDEDEDDEDEDSEEKHE